MSLMKEIWFQNFIAALIFIFIPATLFVIPEFFMRITKNKLFQYLFRSFLVCFLLWVQIWDYINRIEENYKDFKEYFYLEFCTIECWVVVYLLIHPNKLLMDCALPMGLIGPVLTVFFGNIDNHSGGASQYLFSEDWIHFFMGHTIFYFSYWYLYLYGFTGTKFNRTMIKRSLIYTTMVGLSVEVYNLAFDTNFIYENVANLFIGNQQEIYYFLFCLFVAFPILFSIFYFVIWFFKPIYNKKTNERIGFSWSEKLVHKIKKEKYHNKLGKCYQCNKSIELKQ